MPFVGIVIFVYILVKLDIRNIFQEIGGVDVSLFLIALIFVFTLFVFQTFKWYVIARNQKIAVPFVEAFKINLISNFYGFITPSKLGAIIRADYLKKYASIGKGISNFVLDKVMDISSLFFIAIFMGFVFRERFDFISLNWLLILFVVFIFAAGFFYSKKRARFVLGVLYRKFVPDKLKEKAKTGFNDFYEDLPNTSFLILIFIINIITWINIYFVTYLVGLSLGVELSFIYFLAILPLSTLVAQIPVTISGLGTREATMIGLFGLFGVGAAKVFSMSIVNIFITTIIPSIIASFLIFRRE